MRLTANKLIHRRNKQDKKSRGNNSLRLHVLHKEVNLSLHLAAKFSPA